MQPAAAVYEGRRPRDRRRGRVLFWLLAGLCVAALIGGAATALSTARSFTVPSGSMGNTVIPGDRVVVDRTAPIHRGDVVVEHQLLNAPGYYIRRVIGLPGDHVACCDLRGRVTVNGKALDESYVYPGNPPSPTRFHITVPKGKLWLMGDHRSIALDSRIEGPLAVQPVGPVFVILRAGHAMFLRTPHTFTADGLAPASSPTHVALIGGAISTVAFALLVVLAIFGIVRYVMRGHQRRRAYNPHYVTHAESFHSQ